MGIWCKENIPRCQLFYGMNFPQKLLFIVLTESYDIIIDKKNQFNNGKVLSGAEENTICFWLR